MAGAAATGATKATTAAASRRTKRNSIFSTRTGNWPRFEDAVKKLAAFPEKKALIYFSSGISKTGIDNQSQLKATNNAAMRAQRDHLLRGCARAASFGARRRCDHGFQARHRQFTRQQPTGHARISLQRLAGNARHSSADTGGKALLDNNDLSMGIKQAQTRHEQLLHPGLLQQQPGGRRQIPPYRSAA